MLAVVGLTFMLAAFVALVLAHVRPTGLSPLRNPVSQYGISSAASFYRAQTVAMALAAIALPLSLRSCLSGREVPEVVVSLALFAVARALISWFPMDAPGAPRSHRGSAHGILAIVAFLSISFAASRLNTLLSSQAAGTWWYHVSSVVSTALKVALVLMIVARLAQAVRPYFGLIERLFYAACITWIVTTCWACAFLHGW